jgi:hypothetical protein
VCLVGAQEIILVGRCADRHQNFAYRVVDSLKSQEIRSIFLPFAVSNALRRERIRVEQGKASEITHPFRVNSLRRIQFEEPLSDWIQEQPIEPSLKR